MFQTTSDQQAQSSVIVVSSSSSNSSSSGGGGSGLSIINNTSLVSGNVSVDGAINAFNDAIDHQSHHHLNTIFSSYFNCKNQHLIEFPQFHHHHHHHVHTYNLNLNFNNFHTPSSSSSVSSLSTNTSNNNSNNNTEASIILDTFQKIAKEIKPSPLEEIDKINHNLSSLNPFNSTNETGSKLTNKKEAEILLFESNTNKLMELDKCLIKSKDEETPKEQEESIEIDNNNNSICLVKETSSSSSSSSSKLEDDTMPHAIAFNLKRKKNKTNQKKTNSLIDISTSVKSKILIQLKKIPKRLGLRKRRKTTELYDSNNTSSCSSNSSCNILKRRKSKSTNQDNNKNKYTNKEQNNLTASLPSVNTRIHFTRSQTRASQSNTIDKHNNSNNNIDSNNVDTKGKKSSTKSLKSKILNGVTKRLKKNTLDENKEEKDLEVVERRLKKSQPNLTSILLLDDEDDDEQHEEKTEESSASSSAIASSSLINHVENLTNNNILQASNENKSIQSNNIQDNATNTPNIITEIFNEQNQPNNEQNFYDQTQNLIQNQQFIYDIEMMPQQVHQLNHQQQLLQPNLNQLLIDESRSSSIYSLFNAATSNNNNQIKQDLLKLSYDKFKQFRLNEKLLQQTVLIRNAIKMLQYDIQFQQEQEQQMIIQQQQQHHHMQQQQQQHLMEFSNNTNNNRTTSATPNLSSSPMVTNYDNLEDFLTRSEFSNNAMLNHNRTTSQSLPSSTLVLNSNLSNPNNSNQQSVNVNNCYYVITSSNQVQMLNNESNGLGEENVDVDGNEEEDDDDEEEEEEEEEVEEDDDEEDISEEEEEETDEEVDDFTDEPDEPLFTQMNVVVIKNEKLNQKQFENKENQIGNYLNETKKFTSLKDNAPVSNIDTVNIDLTNTHRSSEININNKSDLRGEQEEEEESILIESQLTVNLTLTNENENENFLDIKLETATPPSIITKHANVEDFQNMNSPQLTKNNTEEFFT